MSVEILASCPGCGVCTRPNVCPTDAISISGGKAVIGKGCIDCGLCIPVCPIGVIKMQETDTQDMKRVTETESEAVPEREEDAHDETNSGA